VLLHARSLYDFLTREPSPNKKHDDIVAGHFVTKEGGNLWRSSKLGNFKKLYGTDIDKFRAHLTYTRIKRKDTEWPDDKIRKILYEINAAFDEFVARLPKSERPHWEIPDLKEKGKDYFQKS